ncbi:alpha/beta hydrolase [Gordonia sp. HY002]|uniref:alpha/beta fold hydrolase n=1 Tax=Gordonia zhenghanii TaxID=2911516 RepID=UPI001EF07249|nr:alpha/beta hydrolase [Gordonia zhenghanii]MCF8572158.1 alpha/beta hydrolase [Gordonia zhenghanii]MCF8606360.1 alpha/beta hydrolase [Gordonia zhenghanii]
MAVFEYDGETICYSRHGTGSRVVIFLHNLGSSRLIWEPTITALDPTYSAYALDFPGYGDSELTAVRSVEWLVDMVEAFVAEIGATRLDLVGNCVGSAVSLLLAERRPELIDSMVVFNPATAATLRPTPLGLLSRLAARSLFPRAILGSVSLPKTVAKAIIWFQTGSGSVTPGNTRLKNRLQELWTDKGRMFPMASVAPTLSRPFTHIDRMVSDTFAGIDVQMVWGEKNRILSAKEGRKLAERLGVPYLGLSAAGHLAMLEVSPDLVPQMLERAHTAR